nr:LLM class flavin-dependent oxidoreductase [Mycobacterium tilburgii]
MPHAISAWTLGSRTINARHRRRVPRGLLQALGSVVGVRCGGARSRVRGVFTDPAKVHDIEHKGRYFSVPGPFLCEPSPQRTPVLFQAGASPRGVKFAAANAEAACISGPTPQIVRGPVRVLRKAAAAPDRDPPLHQGVHHGDPGGRRDA